MFGLIMDQATSMGAIITARVGGSDCGDEAAVLKKRALAPCGGAVPDCGDVTEREGRKIRIWGRLRMGGTRWTVRRRRGGEAVNWVCFVIEVKEQIEARAMERIRTRRNRTVSPTLVQTQKKFPFFEDPGVWRPEQKATF